MADIRHREPSRRGHEVVIFQIGRQIELGARTQGFAEERPAGTGTNRHAAHPFVHDPAVRNAPTREPPPRLAQIVERRHGFGQLAHHAETHPLALVGDGASTCSEPIPNSEASRQLWPFGALSRLVWQA